MLLPDVFQALQRSFVYFPTTHAPPVAVAREGFRVLLWDHRSHAGQSATPSRDGLAGDVCATVAYVQARPDVDSSRNASFGESLGAAVAIALAKERTPAVFVLRSPLTSLEDMAQVHYPWLSVGPLLVNRYSSIDHIRHARSRVLVVAWTRDGVSRWLRASP